MTLKAKKTVTIPDSVKHYIMANYETLSYDSFGANRFGATTDAKKVYKLWKKEGKKTSGGICTLGGAYLVAMAQIFGSTGDVLQIILKNGKKFWVVMTDSKNSSDSNCGKYGHVLSGVTDVLEWSGNMSGGQSALKTSLDKKGYLGKRVKKVINYGKYKSGVKLEGGADAVQVFIDTAREHADYINGKKVRSGGHAWVQSKTSIGGQAWCAATMCAVAIETGFAGKIMPKHDYTAHGFGKKIVTEYGGTYIKAYKQGEKNPKVQPGDIAEFQYVNENRHGVTGKWASHHVAVVSKVNSDGTYTVIHGNWSSKYQECKVKKSEIGWFARPDWDKVGGTSAGYGTFGMDGNGPALYDTSSTRADAILRDAGYINKDEELVVKSKNAVADLSVINYTTLAATLVAAFGGGGDSDDDGGDEEYDKWDLKKIKNKTARQIIGFFIDEGFPPCSACGIAGNIQQESGFRTGAADGVGAIGLCQWMGDRATNMKEFVGSDWKNDVEGQCKFLLKEMTDGYSAMVKTMKNYKNTKENCRKATELFCNKFERPGKPMMSKRKKYAVAFWEKIKAAAFDGGKFQWPVPGHKNITSKWGPRWGAWHQGIDIGAPKGSKIVAGEDGKVILEEYNSARGNQIVIDHGNKWYTRYQHNTKNLVSKGDKVKRGEKIATVGSTGYSFGAHLHFEVMHGGTHTNIDKQHDDLNPVKYLKTK